jgi:hypothetical protein
MKTKIKVSQNENTICTIVLDGEIEDDSTDGQILVEEITEGLSFELFSYLLTTTNFSSFGSLRFPKKNDSWGNTNFQELQYVLNQIPFYEYTIENIPPTGVLFYMEGIES